MAEFYGTKIINKEINPKTGNPWTIDDVPSFWRAATQKWVDDHSVPDPDDPVKDN